MTEERWQEIVGRITDTFDVIEHEHEDLDPGPGTIEYIVFATPSMKMKLERTVKPRVVGKRGLGSRRVGSITKVEYQYSESEFVDGVKAYRWDDRQDEWTDVRTLPGFNL